jgi:hypothetical protein
MTLDRLGEMDKKFFEKAQAIHISCARIANRDIINNFDDTKIILAAMGEITALYDELWKSCLDSMKSSG